MILTREKAIKLLCSLDVFCRNNGIDLPKGRDERYIKLSKIVMQRYGSVILEEDGVKTLCNNPRKLKRWAMSNKGKKDSWYICPCCGSLKRKTKTK